MCLHSLILIFFIKNRIHRSSRETTVTPLSPQMQTPVCLSVDVKHKHDNCGQDHKCVLHHSDFYT